MLQHFRCEVIRADEPIRHLEKQKRLYLRAAVAVQEQKKPKPFSEVDIAWMLCMEIPEWKRAWEEGGTYQSPSSGKGIAELEEEDQIFQFVLSEFKMKARKKWGQGDKLKLQFRGKTAQEWRYRFLNHQNRVGRLIRAFIDFYKWL